MKSTSSLAYVLFGDFARFNFQGNSDFEFTLPAENRNVEDPAIESSCRLNLLEQWKQNWRGSLWTEIKLWKRRSSYYKKKMNYWSQTPRWACASTCSAEIREWTSKVKLTARFWRTWRIKSTNLRAGHLLQNWETQSPSRASVKMNRFVLVLQLNMQNRKCWHWRTGL